MSREEMLDRLRSGRRWDVLIIGGGATGLGTALDAASRGYETLLIDGQDFAKGTSSRSTKLIHGGVRYLARGQVGLVREALHERGVLLRNAPHLVHSLPFVIPSYRWWTTPYYGLGLKVYDALAGASGIGPSRMLSRRETIERLPNIEEAGLRGGVLYHDGQFDDARLAIALLRTFLDRGGTALNYARAIGFVKESGRLRGVLVRDEETGGEHAVSARVVVNATGVFADPVRRLDDPDAPSLVRPSQGIHLVLPRDFLPGDSAILVPRTDDGRVLFAIPWHGRVLIGTTDTPVDRTDLEPRPLDAEIRFLLDHAARYLSRDPRREDVLSVFAGLRPLIASDASKSTKALSREHALFVSESGLVTIVGGKWTTYRRMARDAVDLAAKVAELPSRECVTETLALRGATEVTPVGDLAGYGSDSEDVSRFVAQRPGWDQPLIAGLPYRRGEAVWAARYEMARGVEDVLARRTRALILDAKGSEEAATVVAELLAEEWGRDERWISEQVRSFREMAAQYQLSPRES